MTYCQGCVYEAAIDCLPWRTRFQDKKADGVGLSEWLVLEAILDAIHWFRNEKHVVFVDADGHPFKCKSRNGGDAHAARDEPSATHASFSTDQRVSIVVRSTQLRYSYLPLYSINHIPSLASKSSTQKYDDGCFQ